MAVAITRDPLDAFTGPRPANQKLIFTLYDSATTPDRYVVKVYESDDVLSVGTQIAKLYLTPNTNDRSHFDLSDIVSDRVSAPTATDGGDIVHGIETISDSPADGTGLKKYVVEPGTYTSGTETMDTAGRVTLYLLGGVEQVSAGLDPAFRRFYPTAATKNSFLTDREFDSKTTEIFMADEDEGVAALMNTNTIGAVTTLNKIRIQVLVDGSVDQDQTSVIGTVNNPISDNMHLIPIGPKNLAAYFGGLWRSDWDKVIIQGVESDGRTAVSKSLTIVRDCRPIKHDAVQLAWKNSVGGWDYLRFDGRPQKTVSTETKAYRQTLGNYDAAAYSYNTWDRERTPYHITGKESYNLTNRYFTASERDLLQYALRSKDVQYRVASGDWLPCTIQTSSYTIQPAASQLFEVSLTIELAQDIRC
tara:strand:+ start:751 stop:2004 length:1254 start_codon:yes stop_codon:yes gene_type:complete